MKEQILKLAPVTKAFDMATWLREHRIEYIYDTVDVYTIGEENEWFEIDIWIKGWFIEIRYDSNGQYVRHIVEVND